MNKTKENNNKYNDFDNFNLKDHICTIPNFPKEGIMFRDVTPIMEDSMAFNYVTKKFLEYAKELGVNCIVGPESRGFIFGTPVAVNGEYKFVPVRKPGKLPREVIKVDYDLEYGSNTLCMHKDAINKGDKVLIIDDLLATGGTICACSELVRKLGGEVCGFAFVIELVDLKGREKIELANEGKAKILSLTSYEGE